MAGKYTCYSSPSHSSRPHDWRGPIRYLILVPILVLALSSSSPSMWALISLDDLVQDCDLIVVGTLGQVSEYSSGGTDYGSGTITVDEVVWGDAKISQAITLKWENGTGVICPRLEHRSNQGTKGIWLLTKGNAGEVYADYPGRFVDLADRPKVERILRRKNICLRVSKWSVSPREQAIVSIVLRNPTEHSAQFPGLSLEQGVLHSDAAVGLSLHESYWDDKKDCLDWKLKEWVPNRLAPHDDVLPISVPPNQEHRVSLNLRDLADLVPDQEYEVRLEVEGYAPANRVRFCVREPDQHQNSSRLLLFGGTALIGFCVLHAMGRRLRRKCPKPA